MSMILAIAGQFWITLTEMAPYLLFGFGVAGFLSVLISPESVERHLGGRGLFPVLKASLFGVPLPLCSCGVIPVAVSLRKHGASRGATTSFLISTPQTGVDSITVTYGLLGPVFAVARPVIALVTGVVGGWLTDVVEPRNEGTSEPPRPREGCTGECCSHGKRSRLFAQAMRFGFVVLPRDIAKPLLLGILVAGVISFLLPTDFFAGAIGTGVGAILLMMLLGIPMYVCATASVPIAAALIAKGVSPGAALAFLITGPATNAAAVITLWRILGGRSVVVYLCTIALSAVLCGIGLDYFLKTSGLPYAHHHHEMPAAWLGTVSAWVLLALLAFAMFGPRKSRGIQATDPAAGSAETPS